jgi:hypothetical protein
LAPRKISFATFQEYDACIGYERPMTAEDARLALEAGYDCPQIRKHAGVLISSDIPRQSAIVQFGSVQSPGLPSVSEPSDSSRENQKNGSNSKTQPLGHLSSDAGSSVDLRQEDEAALDMGFSDLIDEMAFKVWKCSCCLSMAHYREQCTNEVRCRSCFHYGHICRNCLTSKNRKIWVPKSGKSKHTVIDPESSAFSGNLFCPAFPCFDSIAAATPSSSSFIVSDNGQLCLESG